MKYIRTILDTLQRYAVLVLVIAFFGLSVLMAADRVERTFTSLIMRLPVSFNGTNGYLRAFWNTTNYWSLHTNGQVIQYTATGLRTGFTGTVVHSNALGGGVFITNSYVNGLLIATNLGAAGN